MSVPRVIATVSAATATATTADVDMPAIQNGVTCMVDCSSVGVAAGDTMDIAFETRLDGVNYIEFARLPLIIGTDSDTTRLAVQIPLVISPAIAGNYNVTLAAGSSRPYFGDRMRVVYTIAGGTASFSFRLVVTTY